MHQSKRLGVAVSAGLVSCFVYACLSSSSTTSSPGSLDAGPPGSHDAGVDTGTDGTMYPMSPAACGNGSMDPGEACDDANNAPHDGCTATCTLEAGYRCPKGGGPCRAARCGDGLVAGDEQCEDGDANTGDGCDMCLLENGWVCDNSKARSACRKTVCNDGVREGSEACDDGNTVIGDGCNPFCQVEPHCSQGACTSTCGDGLKLASDTSEECDDGNTKNGDGCSSTCKTEKAYKCTDVVSALPSAFEVPVTFRDFVRAGAGGTVKHPDFETFLGDDASEGLVGAKLGADGKPTYTGICEQGHLTGACPQNAQTTSAANFAEWYSDHTTKFTVPMLGLVEGIPTPASGPNLTGTMLKSISTIRMNRIAGSDQYRNATFGSEFFPLDGQGWVKAGFEAASSNHNFAFTSEIRHWFEFKGGEELTFSGDDDVWVFIGGKLAMDLGGLHPRRARRIVLGASGDVTCFKPTPNVDSYDNITAPCATPRRALGLTPGRVYEVALFHAERRTNASNFDLTLAGFVSAHSECVSTCGDGIVQWENGETCDDGNRNNDDDCDRNCQSFLIQ